ncbi:hypothetical protein ABFT80_23910 [Mesorhizobium sp. SB112]|uniref:hypothetical protein n=1 Tax=Mesorhizobium sp. SB112 TaxID=3151853 RepID=UPI003266F41E
MGKPNPVSIRIPVELKDWLNAKAKAEHRNMTGQLLHILALAKQAEDAKEAA